MNNKGLIIGSIDDPIDATGRSQAKQAAQELAGERFDYILSSPLARAKETAEIIGSALGLVVRLDHRLRERCVGDYEGGPQWPEILEKFLGEEMSTMGAESLSDFTDRVLGVLRDFSRRPHPVLLVTHALPLLVLVKEIKWLDLKNMLRYQIPHNCVPIKFYFGDGCECGSNFYEPENN